MFEVKVKTLDGRTQEYSVPDNATVLQFKEIVQEKTEIAVERQRLLYQGRALLDERLLNSYEVAGNVMHLVTRFPPQVQPTEELPTDIDENSDINRDQIRNIISDVFGNIGDLNHPMGVSVNNEGNRMDITVNIPTQNRLSLSRLRQNYVMRLLHQARNVINHMEDPSTAEPPSDRERMRQADPYDIGPNDELMTEVTSQPLPISNLADMIGMTRALWRSSEPQLEQWESVLRRENAPNSTPRTDIEMQRMHDSASRYVHLFSHVLHILSDYLVEFQSNAITRATAARTTSDAARTANTDGQTVPLTGASDESGMAYDQSPRVATASGAPIEDDDRSRYLYVFSEMPAQLVQVRLDVDSTIHDLRPATPTAPTAAAQPTTTMPPPRTPESTRPTAASTQPASSAVPTNPDTPDPRSRPRRRFPASSNATDNLLRSTLHSALLGSGARSQMSSGPRSIRTSPQFMENIDPYLRCQSRHFQHPSSLRSGAVISTFSGIRLRENSRPRPRTNNPASPATSTANNTTTPMTNVRTQSHDTDPMQSMLSGLMNSILGTSSSDILRSAMHESTAQPAIRRSNFTSMLDSSDRANSSNLNAPLSQIFPEMLSNQDLDPDNFITNQIIHIVINQLTLFDFLGIVRGQYTSLNRLRLPLQEILMNHQREVGSRDTLIDHVVSDMEYFNRGYIAVFERLRSGDSLPDLSEEARSSFNIRLDIFRTMNNLNRHHFNSMIDMIMRSPTNQGFGQLLMNSLTSHHAESLALIDIICNDNDELRQFLIKSLLDSLVSSMNQSTGGDSATSSFGFDILFGDTNSGLFRRPDHMNQLREHTINNFVTYLVDEDEGGVSTVVNGDGSLCNTDSIEDMVTNLSEDICRGAVGAEIEIPLPVCVTNGAMEHNGPGWQGEVPAEWIQVMSRDAGADATAMLISDEGGHALPYSDAYVAGMPAKRRKVIVSQRQRAVRPAAEMMHDCIDQAIRSVGLVPDPMTVRSSPSLTEAFQEMVTERIGQRLGGDSEDGALNFVPERFPTAEHNFNNRKKRADNEESKKNN